MNAAVRLERVFQCISARSVLNDVNLRIEEGEVFVLIGPNGSGKTILLRLILGLDTPTAGLVEVLGKELGSLGDREFAELRRTTGMVFQGGSLLNDLTVVDNIMLPLRYASLDPEDRQRRVRLLMMQLRLDGLENARPAALSSGLLRKVEMARALINRPRLLLWDGLADGLDLAAEAEVLDLLIEQKKQYDMTLIMTSDRIDKAIELGARIGILDGGRMLFVGTTQGALERKRDDLELRCALDGHP